jgi:hypothetical protein
MEITAVKFTEDEQSFIFRKLIGIFDVDTAQGSGQTINFEFCALYAEAFLELYSEGYMEEDTNAGITTSQQVLKFWISFFNTEGIEVAVNCDFERQIEDYYQI